MIPCLWTVVFFSRGLWVWYPDRWKPPTLDTGSESLTFACLVSKFNLNSFVSIEFYQEGEAIMKVDYYCKWYKIRQYDESQSAMGGCTTVNDVILQTVPVPMVTLLYWIGLHLFNDDTRPQRWWRYCIIISPVSEGLGDVMVLRRSRPPPAARNGVNAITQKPRDGLFSNLVYTLVVIVSWPD